MKLLVLGSNGMAGHMICKYLTEKGYCVDTAARSDAKFLIDVENFSQTTEFLEYIKNDYNFIINCIGLLVKDSVDRPDRAAIINSWFPHVIEYAIKDSKTKLIHLSTDCVFDGKKGNYVESDVHTEMNFYGRSKSLGEVDNEKDITFRMSIIGTEIKRNGTGLLNWVLNNKDAEIPGWKNAWWNGITTLQLAKCVDMYMKNPFIHGINHVVNNNVNINKYDLLCLINDIFKLQKTIIKTTGTKDINKILIDTKETFDFQIPDYKTQLTELKNYV